MIPGLNEYSASFAEALLAAFPWMQKHAHLESHPDTEVGTLIVEYSPPPARKGYNFWISTDQGEITVGYGMFHCHFDWPNNSGDEYWQDPFEFVHELVEDRVLIQDWTKSGKWTGSSTLEAGQAPDLTELDEDHVLYLRSWSGKLDQVFSGLQKGD